MSGLPGTPPVSDLPTVPRHALVIATAAYDDPSLRQLRAPAHDAAEFIDVLGAPEIGGFTVEALIDRTVHEIRVGIEDFLSGRGPDEVIVVYLSCHGLRDARNRLYFAATDTKKNRLGSTGVESRWLLDQLDECRARRQVLILDCCFSGAFAAGAKGDAGFDLKEHLVSSGRGRIVLTASRSGEYSFEGEPLTDTATPGSVFTTGLIDGLRSGAADTDHDGLISVEDAYNHAFTYVQAHSADQTPQRWLFGAEGQIWLARSPVGAGIESASMRGRPRTSLDDRASVAAALSRADPPEPDRFQVMVSDSDRWHRTLHIRLIDRGGSAMDLASVGISTKGTWSKITVDGRVIGRWDDNDAIHEVPFTLKNGSVTHGARIAFRSKAWRSDIVFLMLSVDNQLIYSEGA